MRIKPPSSSGLGHLSFKEATGIRIPLGVLNFSILNILHQKFLDNHSRKKEELVNFSSFFGSMLERLMGTDCKSAGNAFAGSNPARPNNFHLSQ